MIDGLDAMDMERVRMIALTDWRKAEELAQRLIAERNQREIPERVARVRDVVRRFAPQIAMMGEDPNRYLADQDTDLMRADAWTSPGFLRSKALS